MCLECGFNRRLGQHVNPAVAGAPAAGRRAQGGGIGVPAALKQPWVVFVAPVLLLGGLALAGRSNEGAALAFFATAFVFGLGVLVWVLVTAFRESIGTGFLTLCVPFYVLYFVFAKNENAYLKAAFGASIVINVMTRFVNLSETIPGW